jgi:hypothetical protein
MKIHLNPLLKRSPYAPYPMRCQFAVEAFKSIMAPEDQQKLELELLAQWSDEGENG